MIDEIVNKISELRQRAEKYRDQLSKNEMLTRYVLIDPFLRLLGWDVDNPEHIRPEFPSQDGRPDYALLQNGRPIAFVWAKRLGEQDDFVQHVDYCINNEMKYFVTTDGARYVVYNTLALKPLPEKVSEWDITKDEPGEVFRKSFILLRYSPFMEEAPKPLTHEISIKKIKPEHIKEGYKTIIFPDGKYYELKSYRDLLLKTVLWLISTARLTKDSLPIKIGRTRYLINDKPVHANKRKFDAEKEVSGYYIECNLSGKNIVKYTKRLLEQFGVDPGKVYLQK